MVWIHPMQSNELRSFLSTPLANIGDLTTARFDNKQQSNNFGHKPRMDPKKKVKDEPTNSSPNNNQVIYILDSSSESSTPMSEGKQQPKTDPDEKVEDKIMGPTAGKGKEKNNPDGKEESDKKGEEIENEKSNKILGKRKKAPPSANTTEGVNNIVGPVPVSTPSQSIPNSTALGSTLFPTQMTTNMTTPLSMSGANLNPVCPLTTHNLPINLPVLQQSGNLGPGKYKRFFTFHGFNRIPRTNTEAKDFISCFLRYLDSEGDILSFHSRSLMDHEDTKTYRSGIPNGMRLVRLDVYHHRHPDFIHERKLFPCQVVQTFLLYAAGIPVLRITMSEPKIHIMESATVSGYIHFGTRHIESPDEPNQAVVPCKIAVSPVGDSGTVTTFYPHP